MKRNYKLRGTEIVGDVFCAICGEEIVGDVYLRTSFVLAIESLSQIAEDTFPKQLAHPDCDKVECEKIESGDIKIADLFPCSNNEYSSDEYITTDIAATLLKFNIQSIRFLYRSGALKGKKIGRSILIQRGSVNDYLKNTSGMKKNDPRR